MKFNVRLEISVITGHFKKWCYSSWLGMVDGFIAVVDIHFTLAPWNALESSMILCPVSLKFTTQVSPRPNMRPSLSLYICASPVCAVRQPFTVIMIISRPSSPELDIQPWHRHSRYYLPYGNVVFRVSLLQGTLLRTIGWPQHWRNNQFTSRLGSSIKARVFIARYRTICVRFQVVSLGEF